MQVTTYTEKQIQELNLWPDGEYDFEVIGAEETISSNGNEMIKLKLKIYNDKGKAKFIDDYLVDIESMAFKIKHCADTLGLSEAYNNGSLEAYDMMGKAGKLMLRTDKDKKGQYPDKNAVKDYVKQDDTKAASQIANGETGAFLDDEIPFG